MKEILLYIKNIDGKIIIKKVPDNVVSLYEAIGWKIYEEKKQETEDKSANKAYFKESNK